MRVEWYREGWRLGCLPGSGAEHLGAGAAGAARGAGTGGWSGWWAALRCSGLGGWW